MDRTMPEQHSDLDDEGLLLLATAGDAEAFGTLYDRYLHELYRYVFYRVGDHHETEDITANAFIRTWEYLPRLSGNGAAIRSFRAWLYRVAKNLVTDFYRTRETVPVPDGFHRDEDSVERASDEDARALAVARAIRELKPAYQQIIILRFINQLSHKECAEIMKVSIAQARVLQHRALNKLREMVDERRN
jgi:RNA polymerase sigma-70 factor, ECF subfamily